MGINGPVGLRFYESVEWNREMTVSGSLADGTAERACYVLFTTPHPTLSPAIPLRGQKRGDN